MKRQFFSSISVFRAFTVFVATVLIFNFMSNTNVHAATKDFTLQPGALIEAIYINGSAAEKSNISSQDLPALKGDAISAGGNYLASFEVVEEQTIDNPSTHVMMVQWADPSQRNAFEQSASYQELSEFITSNGFYGVQEETPISLDSTKLYDFTAAWTVAKSPEQMEVVSHVLGQYFGAIAAVLQKYQISTKSMFAPHPAAPQVENRFMPQIMGLFEWQNLSDVAKFEKDPDFTAHVDIRNATFSRKEDKILATLLDI